MFQKGQKREKDFSSYQCDHCDKIRNIAKNFLARREEYKKRNKKIHHAHSIEDDDPPMKLTKEDIEYYVLFLPSQDLCHLERILGS
jgi:hypothetical protein